MYLHGLAGDFAARAMDEHTVLATDTVAHLSEAFRYRVRDRDGFTWIAGGAWMKAWTREKRLKTRSVAGTLGLGEMLAEILVKAGRLVILRGELGAGKTTLVKGIAEALGAAAAEDVVSPTFTLVHTFEGRRVRLYHLDVYRLETEGELATLGVDEMVEEAGALVVVEWGEKFASLTEMADAEVAMEVGEVEGERLIGGEVAGGKAGLLRCSVGVGA